MRSKWVDGRIMNRFPVIAANQDRWYGLSEV